ncbi:MAG TPA: tetratricopeptide repeat protein [Pyrinomonadaceae bacterium]|nr:tetratricopeptide repeat protein [Pyrinomonadaceae bacterium]
MNKTILFILLCAISAAAQKLESPKLTPTPSTENQQRLIKEGVVLHDRGDYDGAITKYQAVLSENPNNVTALYEMSYSFSLKKEHQKSIELAYKGAQYKSDLLSQFYIMIGNGLDELGESKKAVDVYKQGIKIQPDDNLLYYNLALTYSKLGDLEESKKNLKKSAYLNPNHPSTQVALAQIFQKTGYRVPALFAIMRFLTIEPNSGRSANGFALFKDLINGGARPGKNPNEINIFMDLNAKKDEGDFGSIDLILGLSGAASKTEKNKNKTEVELLVDQLSTVLAIIDEQDAKGDKSKFTWRYYIPYFIELKKKGFVEPFVYYISTSSNMKGAREWLQANETKVKEFLTWSKSYQWPKE